ncbi:MAG: HAMP domain-containing protein [Candidatus Gastranaerophilales bacterium]|nr:HAMP domain-containing protein [Candidatus Gastranaerophilales bacterium]
MEDGKLTVFRGLVDELITNNLVTHVGLIDNKTNKYDWSSIKEMEGTETDIDNPYINAVFQEHFGQVKGKQIYIRKFDADKYTLVVSFFIDDALLNLVEILIRGNITLALTFIIFGFLSASILARQVTKPIEKLIIGIWEFSKGNLKYRTTIETDDEIGILAKAFNYMAEKLDDLYSSMEKKVKERTKELSSKNEELNKAYDDLKQAQSLLVHNEKMRSLGELVAGVAHELNNPINFIYGNMTHLKEYSKDLIEIISIYEEIQQETQHPKYKEIEDLKEDIDYEFLKDDIQELIKSCTDGAERSKQIVLDLKDFSRLDQGVIKDIDLNESIDSTLNILKNKYKNRIDIVKEYGDIPKFECFAGQMNQVFMNILDNAIQAIKETGNVYIRTKVENNNMVVEIEDTGQGIPEDVLPKIFDPFFTTKPVGAGSGMGLSITYRIVKSHKGDIEVESEIGKGTKFIVKIPLNWQELAPSQETPVVIEGENEVNEDNQTLTEEKTETPIDNNLDETDNNKQAE